MQVKEMREKSIGDLYKNMRELRREVGLLKMSLSVKKSSDWAKKNQLKKEIARLKTVVSEKEILKNYEKISG